MDEYPSHTIELGDQQLSVIRSTVLTFNIFVNEVLFFIQYLTKKREKKREITKRRG